MSSFRKDVVGFFEEPTTYKHDFRRYPLAPRAGRETVRNYPSEKFAVENRSPGHFQSLKTMTAYDTLQQLSYQARLPFNAMLRPKEIIGTNPQQTFCQRIIEDEGLEEAIKTRPRQYVSPAISLDNVQDPNTRKLMVDFTYMTTASRAAKEAWSEFHPREPCMPNTVFEKTVDPFAQRLKLLPDIPAGFEASARKWDSIQERYQLDMAGELSKKSRKNTEQVLPLVLRANSLLPLIPFLRSYQERLSKLVTVEEKDAVRMLIKKNKLRLPYEKMPLSYGGFRPQFAIEVPLEAKESSPFDPNLSVASAVNARLAWSLES